MASGKNKQRKLTMWRFFCFIMLATSLCACSDFLVQKLDLDQLQSERLSEVQWDAIDQWPNPPGCDEGDNNQSFSPCFLNFMGRSIEADQQLLGELRTAFGDTVHLNLVVDPSGFVHVGLPSSQNKMDSLNQGLLRALESLISAEAWTPGLKRGLPVQVAFDYDLILQNAE